MVILQFLTPHLFDLLVELTHKPLLFECFPPLLYKRGGVRRSHGDSVELADGGELKPLEKTATIIFQITTTVN